MANVNLIKDSKTTFTLYNLRQQKISLKNMNLKQGSSTVDLSELVTGQPKGIYFLVTETDQYIVSNKLIKE
jgi:hypothetical protein